MNVRAAIIAPIIILSTLIIVAQGAAVADQEGDYVYTMDNGVAIVIDYTGPGGAITIPSSLGGYQVVAIGNQAFYYQTSLTSVVIPTGVTVIGESAFVLCTSLTSVQIPSTVSSIGEWAFSSCTSLSSITLPEGVSYIGDWAFESCTSLASIVIPSSITSIGDWTFDYCSSLGSVTIGSGVEYIGANAFHRCTSLTSMTFLGQSAPSYVDAGWIEGTPEGIRGHAYASSDFPSPGELWNGLTMGSVIYVEGVPGIPQNLHANGNNAQVALAWSAPGSAGSSPVTGYKVFRSTGQDGSYSLISSPSGLTYTDSGLNVGQTYWYKVSAVNSNGEGERCAAVSVIVPPAASSGIDPLLVLTGVVVAAAILVVAFLVYQKNQREKRSKERQRKSKRK